MHRRDEHAFELRRRHTDALVQHFAEVGAESIQITRLGRLEVVDRPFGEERADHRADTVDCQRNTGLFAVALQACFQACAQRLQPVVHFRCQQLQCAVAGSHRQRIAAERSRLIDRTGGSNALHDLPAAPVSADRKPAADDFAEAGQIRFNAEQPLRTAPAHTETGHHLIKDQQRAVACRYLAQTFKEAGLRQHYAHISGNRLDDYGGNLIAVPFKSKLGPFQVIVRHSNRVHRYTFRHPRAVRQTQRGYAGASLDQEAVSMAVVRAFELEDFAAAGISSGQTDSTHGSFSTRVDHPHDVDRRHAFHDSFSHLGLQQSRRPEACSFYCRLL
ncbi:hypothetical protein D3C73_999800 [compost metagenome]